MLIKRSWVALLAVLLAFLTTAPLLAAASDDDCPADAVCVRAGTAGRNAVQSPQAPKPRAQAPKQMHAAPTTAAPKAPARTPFSWLKLLNQLIAK